MREEWLNYAPLLYDHLTNIDLSNDYSTLTAIRWVPPSALPPQKDPFKYSNHSALFAATSHHKGTLCAYNILIPQQPQDLRLTTVLHKLTSVSFPVPLAALETTEDTIFAAEESLNSGIVVYNWPQFHTSGKSKATMPSIGRVHALAPKRQCVLAVGSQVSLYDVGRGKVSLKFKSTVQCSTVAWIDENCFVSGAMDLNIWDTRTPYPTATAEALQGNIKALCGMSCMKTFLSGGNSLVLWDRRKLVKHTYHSEPVTVIKDMGSKNNQLRFVSGGVNAQVILWSTKPQFMHAAHRNSIADISYDDTTGLFLTIQHDSAGLMLWLPSID